MLSSKEVISRIINEFGSVEYSLSSEYNMGICLECGKFQDEVEPDTRNYTCHNCNAEEVFGIEEAVITLT